MFAGSVERACFLGRFPYLRSTAVVVGVTAGVAGLLRPAVAEPGGQRRRLALRDGGVAVPDRLAAADDAVRGVDA